MTNTAKGAERRDHPRVPYYHDGEACGICGSDGHTSRDCPFAEQIGCSHCLGTGSVLHVCGASTVEEVCEHCGGGGAGKRVVDFKALAA